MIALIAAVVLAAAGPVTRRLCASSPKFVMLNVTRPACTLGR